MRARFRRMQVADERECLTVRALMTDYADESIAAAARGRVDDHVIRCPRCRQVLANLQHTLTGLRLLRAEPDDEAADADAVARARSAWRGKAS